MTRLAPRSLLLTLAGGLLLWLPACAFHGPYAVHEPYPVYAEPVYDGYGPPLATSIVYADVSLIFDRELGCHRLRGRPDYYFHHDHYFRYQRGQWDVSARADGPWRRSQREQVPERLRRHYERGHAAREPARDRSARPQQRADVRDPVARPRERSDVRQREARPREQIDAHPRIDAPGRDARPQQRPQARAPERPERTRVEPGRRDPDRTATRPAPDVRERTRAGSRAQREPASQARRPERPPRSRTVVGRSAARRSGPPAAARIARRDDREPERAEPKPEDPEPRASEQPGRRRPGGRRDR